MTSLRKRSEWIRFLRRPRWRPTERLRRPL
jgi:hypothetical protein